MPQQSNRPAVPRGLALSLALVAVLGPAGIDMYLASMLAMARELHTSYANVQLSLTVFLLALWRSLGLGAAVMLCTVVLSVLAGLAFRKRLAGGNTLFFIVVASLIMPSIIVSLGIGLEFRLIDNAIKAALEWLGMESALEGYGTSLGLFTSALGAHLTWTLPFGLLIMFAVFNRFNPAYEEAARDLGATPWQGFAHVVLPLIAPSVVGIGMFGFTLSWDEIARTSQAIGDVNTLPLELQGLTSTVTTPSIYALGTLTTVVSFAVMGITLALVWALGRRGKGRPG